MQFQYCPACGAKAIQKEIGDEGLMPYCDRRIYQTYIATWFRAM